MLSNSKKLQKLWLRDYKIKIVFDALPATPENWKVTGKTAALSDGNALVDYLRTLDVEFRKYPPSFIKSIRLKSIVLAKKLSVDGQLLAAMPDYTQQMLWLDFKGYS